MKNRVRHVMQHKHKRESPLNVVYPNGTTPTRLTYIFVILAMLLFMAGLFLYTQDEVNAYKAVMDNGIKLKK